MESKSLVREQKQFHSVVVVVGYLAMMMATRGARLSLLWLWQSLMEHKLFAYDTACEDRIVTNRSNSHNTTDEIHQLDNNNNYNNNSLHLHFGKAPFSHGSSIITMSTSSSERETSTTTTAFWETPLVSLERHHTTLHHHGNVAGFGVMLGVMMLFVMLSVRRNWHQTTDSSSSNKKRSCSISRRRVNNRRTNKDSHYYSCPSSCRCQHYDVESPDAADADMEQEDELQSLLVQNSVPSATGLEQFNGSEASL